MPHSFNNRFICQMQRESINFRSFIKSNRVETIRDWNDDDTQQLLTQFDNSTDQLLAVKLADLHRNAAALI